MAASTSAASGTSIPRAEVLRARAHIIRSIREWFWGSGFLEVEAPTLVRSPAMEEHLEAFRVGERFLHTSPEFALKRVLAAGLPRIFSLGPCYRDEEWGPLHGHEFTMLEWYRVGCGYEGIASDLVGLLGALGIPEPVRVTVREAFVAVGGRPEDPIEAQRTWVNDVEQRFQRPTLVFDYPADEAALSELRGEHAERFELYWKGVELANAFTELRDPTELLERWAKNNARRRAAGRAPHPVDARLVEAVARHPRAGGISLGIDRLVMLLLGEDDIERVRVCG